MSRAFHHAFGLLLALTLLPAWAGAEDAFPLRVVEFEGAEHFETQALMDLSGLEIGAAATKGDFERALRRLDEAGVFESLQYRYGPLDGGYRLTIVVQEVSELFAVRFDGFGVPDDELRALLREKVPLFAERVPPTGPMISMIGNALQAWWRETGAESKVDGRLVPAGPDNFEMLFGPRRPTSNIAYVKFDNSGVLSVLELQRKFNQVAMGEAYSEARFKELLHHNVRPLYAEAGYMNVRFCPCEVEPDPDTAGVLVQVHVEQGEIYKFGDLNWPDPLPIEPAKLSKLNRLRSGETVNMSTAYETMSAITESMKRQGYMKSQATFDTRVDHEAALVHLDIEIAAGDQYAFSRLFIRGLDILSEPAVRKRWGLEVGAPFDIRYPALFLERVKSDAMLENLKTTDWHMRVDETRKSVDVSLVFNGKKRNREFAPIIEKPDVPF